MQKSFRKLAMGSSALAFAVIAAAPVYSQVDTITVTAQRREATLQDTPVAVTAVQGDVLEQSQLRDVRDLQTLVPSLRVNTDASSSNTSFAIRSIGSSTFNWGIEPSVGVFVDGVYRSRNGASINDFLGVQRVEVLRGPQSTLFGKNTSAGVISFITEQPADEWGSEVEFTVGRFNQQTVRGMITGPLGDTVSGRLDLNYNSRDGFITNVTDGRDVNERDRWGWRGQLLWEPGDRFSLRLIADQGFIDENCCAAPFTRVSPTNAGAFAILGVTQLPVNPFSGQIAIDGSVRSIVDTGGLSAEMNWEFDGATFTSITAYRAYDEEQDIDPDWVDQPFNQRRFLDQDYQTTTQEFRLTSTGDRTVDYLFGAYFFHQNLNTTNITRQGPLLRPFADLFSDLDGNPFTPGSAVGLVEALCNGPQGPFIGGCVPGQYLAAGSGQSSSFYQNNDTFALFGQLDWHVNDRLTITGGLRYTNDEKDARSDILIDDPFAALDFVQIGFNALIFPAAFTQATGLPYTPGNVALVQTLNPTGFAAIVAGAQAAAADPNVNSLLGLGALQFFPPAPNFTDSRSDSATTGALIVAYDVNDNVNIYGSYTRGFKGGGYALDSAAARVGSFSFDPETVTAWEAGIKVQTNELILNTAIFRQNIEDFQTNVFTGSSFVPDNAGEIQVGGIEIEALFQPTENLTFTGGVTWLWESKYVSFANGPCPVSDTSNCTFRPSATSPALVPVQDLSGRDTGAAELTGNFTALYTRPITSSMEAFVRGEVYFITDRALSVDLDPLLTQEGYNLLNGSIGLAAQDGSWEVQVWGRNLGNEEYLQGAFNSTLPGNINGYPGDPRTWGITVRARR
ncbi:TonB-dependent receptor [Hyphobacterium sp. HN65]|uniref:TonB-dependent receptor n=1 Tax=Hyphobacterium lacteum TaxID=3116575 RepID=A0ABU7LNU1_9PROT|nr:TonB-dependent receptor [Hyphobacterium sp. HN65]MEE2525591.1 TonB-dependent receptor [Hyphobacterium sp. HN65]